MFNPRVKEEHAERAADVLVGSLKRTLDDPTLHKRRIDICVERAEERPYQEGRGAERVLHLDVAKDLRLKGRLCVQNHGGNVYRVHARMGDGERLQWQMCIPELKAPHDALEKHTGDFSQGVLLELKRIYGERAMQRR